MSVNVSPKTMGDAVLRVAPLLRAAKAAGKEHDELICVVCDELGWADGPAEVVLAMYDMYCAAPGYAPRGFTP